MERNTEAKGGGLILTVGRGSSPARLPAVQDAASHGTCTRCTRRPASSLAVECSQPRTAGTKWSLQVQVHRVIVIV
jgi:hypothetical protein